MIRTSHDDGINEFQLVLLPYWFVVAIFRRKKSQSIAEEIKDNNREKNVE